MPSADPVCTSRGARVHSGLNAARIPSHAAAPHLEGITKLGASVVARVAHGSHDDLDVIVDIAARGRGGEGLALPPGLPGDARRCDVVIIGDNHDPPGASNYSSRTSAELVSRLPESSTFSKSTL